jgi:hypothetical protein
MRTATDQHEYWSVAIFVLPGWIRRSTSVYGQCTDKARARVPGRSVPDGFLDPPPVDHVLAVETRRIDLKDRVTWFVTCPGAERICQAIREMRPQISRPARVAGPLVQVRSTDDITLPTSRSASASPVHRPQVRMVAVPARRRVQTAGHHSGATAAGHRVGLRTRPHRGTRRVISKSRDQGGHETGR